MKKCKYILDNAATEPKKVQSLLIEMHERGETVEEILEFVKELNKRKISVPVNSSKKIFDVCGTGGSGLKRINLSTVLAIKLSEKFTIAKHGNKAASGRVGSFDVIEKMGFEISDTSEKVIKNLEEKNLSFVYAPAFHPTLKDLAPIRKSISHPTIFNYLGPLLNPVENITAQMVGVSDPNIGEKLAKVALHLNKNILFVHDMATGLDDVSLFEQTLFWKVINGTLEIGNFTPEQWELPRIKDFAEIEGGKTPEETEQIVQKLLNGTAPQAHLNFLEINKRVAEDFFSQF